MPRRVRQGRKGAQMSSSLRSSISTTSRCSSMVSACPTLEFSPSSIRESSDVDADLHVSLSSDSSLWFFVYGPLVHPMVRSRRGISVVDTQPAILHNHRLVFPYCGGGFASIVAQRGYEVHGVVMKCETEDDRERLVGQKPGYCSRFVNVHPYSKLSIVDGDEYPHHNLEFGHEYEFSETAEHDDNVLENIHGFSTSIRARIFVMNEFNMNKYNEDDDDCESDTATDCDSKGFPQERCLRIIADGLREHEADEEYINDQILNAPFVPDRKPHEYLVFSAKNPISSRHSVDDDRSNDDVTVSLPHVSLERYQEHCCQPSPPSSTVVSATTTSNESSSSSAPFYFVVGRSVIRVQGGYDPRHPGVCLLKQLMMQRDTCTQNDNSFDISSALQGIITDPSLPHGQEGVSENARSSPTLQAWAENQLVTSITQGLKAHKVATLVTDGTLETPEINEVWKSMMLRDQQQIDELRLMCDMMVSATPNHDGSGELIAPQLPTPPSSSTTPQESAKRMKKWNTLLLMMTRNNKQSKSAGSLQDPNVKQAVAVETAPARRRNSLCTTTTTTTSATTSIVERRRQQRQMRHSMPTSSHSSGSSQDSMPEQPERSRRRWSLRAGRVQS